MASQKDSVIGIPLAVLTTGDGQPDVPLEPIEPMVENNPADQASSERVDPIDKRGLWSLGVQHLSR